MPTYFWDTSALLHRYVSGPLSRLPKLLISNKKRTNYIADITVLEMASALSKECRRNAWNLSKFDLLETCFMKDIAEGRLNVRDTTKRDFDRTRHLIRYIGVKGGRKITAADALIATCCLEFALEKGERIALITNDYPLYTLLSSVDAFRSSVRLWYLDKAKLQKP